MQFFRLDLHGPNGYSCPHPSCPTVKQSIHAIIQHSWDCHPAYIRDNLPGVTRATYRERLEEAGTSFSSYYQTTAARPPLVGTSTGHQPSGRSSSSSAYAAGHHPHSSETEGAWANCMMSSGSCVRTASIKRSASEADFSAYGPSAARSRFGPGPNSPPRARPPHDDAQFPPPRANISAAIAAPLLPAPASPPSASHHHQQHPGQQPTPAIVQVGQPSSYHSLSPGRPRYVGPPISSTATDFASGGGGSSAAAPVHADWAGEAAVSASRATSAPAPTRPSVGAGGMAQHHPFARRHLPPASSSSSHLRPPLAPPAAARMPSHPSTSHLHPGMRTHSSSGAGTMGAAWAAAGTSDAPPNARGKGAEGGRGEEIGELAAALFDASSVFGEDDALTVYGPSKVASSRQAWGALVTACTDGVKDGTIGHDLYETATAIVAASSGVADPSWTAAVQRMLLCYLHDDRINVKDRTSILDFLAILAFLSTYIYPTYGLTSGLPPPPPPPPPAPGAGGAAVGLVAQG